MKVLAETGSDTSAWLSRPELIEVMRKVIVAGVPKRVADLGEEFPKLAAMLQDLGDQHALFRTLGSIKEIETGPFAAASAAAAQLKSEFQFLADSSNACYDVAALLAAVAERELAEEEFTQAKLAHERCKASQREAASACRKLRCRGKSAG
jgi:hypothetical protein